SSGPRSPPSPDSTTRRSARATPRCIDARYESERMSLSREIPVELGRTALLVIDMQNYTARPDGGEYRGMPEVDREATHGFFFRTLHDTTLPNIRRLLDAGRAAGIEIIYTVIESLTKDGRDLSLDYKISGLVVTRGSWDAQVLDQIAPADDDIV